MRSGDRPQFAGEPRAARERLEALGIHVERRVAGVPARDIGGELGADEVPLPWGQREEAREDRAHAGAIALAEEEGVALMLEPASWPGSRSCARPSAGWRRSWST